MKPFWKKKARRPRREPELRAYQYALPGAPGAFDYAPENLSDTDVYRALSRKAATARQEVQNDHLSGFVLMAQKSIIGEGLRLKSMHPDANIAMQIEAAWKRWEKYAGRSGDSWWEIEWLMVSSLIVDGQIILHVAPDSERGLTVRLVEPMTLDIDHNAYLRDGGIITMGVEKRDWKPVAYWFRNWKERPAQEGAGWAVGDRTRVPAEEILTVSWRTLVGQTRGMPYLTPILMRLEQLRHFDTSEMVAARLGTSRLGFIEQTVGENPYDETKEDEEQEPDDDDSNLENDPISQSRALAAAYRNEQGNADYRIKISQLKPGESFEPVKWDHPSTAYPEFVKTQLRGAAAGLGLSYHSLSGDLSGVNFSAGRIGELSARKTWLALRKLIVDKIHTPLFERWVMEASLRGEFPGMVDDAKAVQLTGPGFAHIQPREAAAANETNIKLRLKSRSQIIREDGHDPDEVFRDIAEENEKLRELGLDSMADGEPTPDDDMDDPDDADAKEEDRASPLADRATRDQIRAEHASGVNFSSLERKYGVKRTPLRRMILGETYKLDSRT